MRHFKSIAAAVLAACICMSMAGCKSDAEKDLDNITEKDIEERLESLDSLESGNNKKEGTETKKESSGITASDEILSAGIYSGKLQLGNTVFSFPNLSASDLVKAGAVFKNCDPETTILSKKDSKNYEVQLDGITYNLRFVNNDKENRALLKDCVVKQTSFSTYDSYNKSFICPKGITIGSTVDELLAAYGEPTSVDIDKYVFTDPDFLIESKGAKEYGAIKDGLVNTGGNSFTFLADLKTNTIKKITVETNNENYSNELIEASEDLSARIDGENLKYTAYFSYPAYLSDCNHVCENNGKRMLIYISGNNINKIGPTTRFQYNDVRQADMTEYTDETLSAFCESIYANDPDTEKYNYSYKINGSTATAVICQNNGSRVYVQLVYLDENFRYAAWGGSNILIFPSTDAEPLSAEDIESTFELFFSIAESVRLELK